MEFTVTMNVVQHIDADDEVEALRAAKEAMPDGVRVQNIQIMNGHHPLR